MRERAPRRLNTAPATGDKPDLDGHGGLVTALDGLEGAVHLAVGGGGVADELGVRPHLHDLVVQIGVLLHAEGGQHGVALDKLLLAGFDVLHLGALLGHLDELGEGHQVHALLLEQVDGGVLVDDADAVLAAEDNGVLLADVVDDVVVAERDVSSLREVSVASVVVVAEASVLEAVVVAFGGADDVLSVLPQAVMLIIVALIIKAAMAFIVFFIWFSSFSKLDYITIVSLCQFSFCPWTNLAEISCLHI